MAGNITTAVATDFIPEIWAQTALEVLESNLVMGKLVTKDTDLTDTFTVGSTLNIPYPGTFSANAKAAGAAVTLQQPTGAATIPVVLSNHYEASILLEDAAKAQVNQDIMRRYMQGMTVALAEKIETTLLAVYTGFTSTAAGVYGTDIATAATIGAARKALNDSKIPQSERYAVVSTKDEISLLGSSDFVRYFQNSNAQDITEGSFGRLYGFDFFVSQLVPTTAATPLQTHNLFFNREAIVFAQRNLPEAPAGTGALQGYAEHNGFGIRVTYAYNPTYLGMQLTLDALWGVAILRGAAGVEVKS